MGLEGNLRELALQEVLQLLAHTRKNGALCITAPLTGLTARVTFESGAVVDGDIQGVHPGEQFTATSTSHDKARQVEDVVLELLTWTDGHFAFVPRAGDAPRVATGVRINTDILLMEGARRVDAWSRLSERIPNARAIPAFVESAGESPPLNLQPQQWEVLTGVDGQRDLLALSFALGRDLLEIAETVYELIGAGLLRLSETPRVRSYATPLSVAAVPELLSSGDLWVPAETESDLEGAFDDEIFDPILVGVLTPGGMPSVPARISSAVDHRACGDLAARRGEFHTALSHWHSLLDTYATGVDADHAREAITLVTRLTALLDVQS